jgi:hypothetical protein
VPLPCRVQYVSSHFSMRPGGTDTVRLMVITLAPLRVQDKRAPVGLSVRQ